MHIIPGVIRILPCITWFVSCAKSCDHKKYNILNSYDAQEKNDVFKFPFSKIYVLQKQGSTFSCSRPLMLCMRTELKITDLINLKVDPWFFRVGDLNFYQWETLSYACLIFLMFQVLIRKLFTTQRNLISII